MRLKHPFHNLDAEDRREAYNEARWPWLFAGFWIGAMAISLLVAL